MPLTPFHLGPAFVLKAAIPSRFSLLAFVFTQVLMDFEPLYYMLTDASPIHRSLHTYLGATAVVLVSCLTAKFICQIWLKVWNKLVAPNPHSRLYIEEIIPYRSVVVGSILGAYSHIVFDSIMHGDLKPLAPYSDSNALFNIVSLEVLHLSLIFLGTIGLFLSIIQVLTNRFKP